MLGNIGLYYNPGANVGGSLTVRAYTTGRNCDLRANKRPTLFNGNPVRDASEIPLIILGEDGNGTTNADAAGQVRFRALERERPLAGDGGRPPPPARFAVTPRVLVAQGSLGSRPHTRSGFKPGTPPLLPPGRRRP